MVYFTSDLHLGHTSVIGLRKRPFYNVDEMNKVLISNYNSVVNPEDKVYILGDLVCNINVEESDKLISQLNGRKFLIKGNHDKTYDTNLFEEITSYKEISEYGKQFILMHYPLLEWKKSGRGSIHLHGHMHNSMNYNLECISKSIRRFDVGVDANSYYPVSVTYIIDFMENSERFLNSGV